MTFTHADTAINQLTTAAASISVTLSGAISVGDVVCVYFNCPTIASDVVSASPSIGTWNFMAAGTNFTRAAYCIVTTAQAGGTTITTTGGGSSAHRSLVADRFTSTGTISFGGVANVAASGTSGNLGSLASVPAGALLWGALHSDTASSTYTAGSSNSVSCTIGSQTSGAQGSDFSEYILSAAGGTESMTWTCSPTISGLTGWQAYFTSSPIVKDATGTAVKQTGATTSATVDITSAATGAWVYFCGGLSATQTGVTFTGWTQVLEGDESTFSHYLVYRRLKQAGDTTFTISWPTSARLVGNWESYTGLDGTTPDELAAFTAHTTGATFPTSSLTPNGTGRWALAFSYARDSTLSTDLPDGTTWTPDAALTERTDAANAAAGTAVWMSIETADSNGTVTQAAHSYTATAAHTESHGGAVLLYLVPPSGTSANVTGVGAAVAVAGGIGTPAGSANVTGVGAQVSVAGGVGSLSAGDVVTGVGAAITAAGGIGTPSGSASVTGVGASASVAAGIGTPAGAGNVTGVGPGISVAAGAGTLSGSENITGVGAQITSAGGVGTPSAGDVVTGVGAQVSLVGGVGTPSGAGKVTGVGSAVAIAGGVGTPSGSANVTGVGASVSTAGGVGSLSAGVAITGVGAQVSVAGGIGSPNSGGSFNVIGVGAQVAAAAGLGTVSAGTKVTGVGALVTTAAGVGSLAASANAQGVGALQALAGGLGTPGGGANVTGAGAQLVVLGGVGTPFGSNGNVNVTGIGAVVGVAGGAGTPTGAIIVLLTVGRACSFQARTMVTSQAAAQFNAGQPAQAGLTTLAAAPWVAMSPDVL